MASAFWDWVTLVRLEWAFLVESWRSTRLLAEFRLSMLTTITTSERCRRVCIFVFVVSVSSNHNRRRNEQRDAAKRSQLHRAASQARARTQVRRSHRRVHGGRRSPVRFFVRQCCIAGACCALQCAACFAKVGPRDAHPVRGLRQSECVPSSREVQRPVHDLQWRHPRWRWRKRRLKSFM